ncbi:MAG: MFS transporter [Burkholderiales bacterium]
MDSPVKDRMSALEIRAALSLSSLFALRMLGLFLILPVFAVHASGIPGGDDLLLVGIALGIYGLTQGVLQIPFGMASDRYGRKRVIVFGLVLFALGSLVAAWADDIWITILGRAIQGAGAISSAVVAFAADLTRDQHRTKTMALIGGSIALMFALSLVAAPAMYRFIGMSGIFIFIGALSTAAIFWTIYVVPPESPEMRDQSRRVKASALGEVLRNAELLRLNFGIFVLHMAQMSLFLVIPLALVEHAGMPVADHWKVYLPVVLISFVLMVPPIMAAERQGRMKMMFIGAVILLLGVHLGFALAYRDFWMVVLLLTLFFVAFNVLEASLPSLVTKLAPVHARGTAIGVYNTTQALGLFVGPWIGGWIAKNFGVAQVFVFGIVLFALWVVVAWPMRAPGDLERRNFPLGKAADPIALREGLARLRGVKEVAVLPDEGIARLTFYRGMLDEQAVVRLVAGEALLSPDNA